MLKDETRHKASMSIILDCGGYGKTVIEVVDESSRIQFLELEIDNAEFVKALGRLSNVKCVAAYRALDHVGMVREQKPLVFEMSDDHLYGPARKAVAVTQADEACDEGWKADHYFGSQDSFFPKDGKFYGSTTQYRFVEKVP